MLQHVHPFCGCGGVEQVCVEQLDYEGLSMCSWMKQVE